MTDVADGSERVTLRTSIFFRIAPDSRPAPSFSAAFLTMERRLRRNAAHILRELGVTRWQDVIFLGAMCVRNECI